MAEELTIREMADKFGVSLRALRFYEDKGLLHPVHRNTQRFYSDDDVSRMTRIQDMVTVGVRINEMAPVIDSSDAVDSLILERAGDHIMNLQVQLACARRAQDRARKKQVA